MGPRMLAKKCELSNSMMKVFWLKDPELQPIIETSIPKIGTSWPMVDNPGIPGSKIVSLYRHENHNCL